MYRDTCLLLITLIRHRVVDNGHFPPRQQGSLLPLALRVYSLKFLYSFFWT